MAVLMELVCFCIIFQWLFDNIVYYCVIYNLYNSSVIQTLVVRTLFILYYY